MSTLLHVRDDGKGSVYEDRGVVVSVAFTAGRDMATTTVTGEPWVTASSRFVATLVGTSSRSVEEALIEGIRVGINNVVVGVGFDVLCHAPNPHGATGTFTVHVVGV